MLKQVHSNIGVKSQMNYSCIYCDDEGELHFEDVSIDLAPVDFARPAPPLNIAVPFETKHMIFFNCNNPHDSTVNYYDDRSRSFFNIIYILW
jgi:hypothetical protein